MVDFVTTSDNLALPVAASAFSTLWEYHLAWHQSELILGPWSCSGNGTEGVHTRATQLSSDWCNKVASVPINSSSLTHTLHFNKAPDTYKNLQQFSTGLDRHRIVRGEIFMWQLYLGDHQKYTVSFWWLYRPLVWLRFLTHLVLFMNHLFTKCLTVLATRDSGRSISISDSHCHTSERVRLF